MERAKERIEHSGFQKGLYFGYGSNGVTYRIHKDKSSGYWIAIAQRLSAEPNSFIARTLTEANKKLGAL
jgi:hypothetical protein